MGGFSGPEAFSVTQGEVAVSPGLQRGLTLPVTPHVHRWLFLPPIATLRGSEQCFPGARGGCTLNTRVWAPGTVWLPAYPVLNVYMYVCLRSHHPRVPGCMCVPCAGISAVSTGMTACQTKSLGLGSAGRVRQQAETLFLCQESQAPFSGSPPRENKPAELQGRAAGAVG